MEFTINQISLQPKGLVQVIATASVPDEMPLIPTITFYHEVGPAVFVGRKLKVSIEFEYKLPI